MIHSEGWALPLFHKATNRPARWHYFRPGRGNTVTSLCRLRSHYATFTPGPQPDAALCCKACLEAVRERGMSG